MSGRFPEHPGSKGKAETGRAAAAALAPKVGTRRAEALAALEALGVASAEQIAERTGRHWSVTRPRLPELAAMGLIVDSGLRGEGALGGKVIRWRVPTALERAAFVAAQAGESAA